MAAMDEQETTITISRTDPVARIYTSDARHLWRLREHPLATEVDGGDDWGNFTVPADRVNPLKIFKANRKPMTDAQKAAAAERLAKFRTSQNPE